ncbi:hypothetical protein [Xanthomonas hortorum]|nr:hypothetical protein [Xanthomonas hortorum]MDV2453316.1 hypothetical protein [Xanthomonas hortorum NBC5720]
MRHKLAGRDGVLISIPEGGHGLQEPDLHSHHQIIKTVAAD